MSLLAIERQAQQALARRANEVEPTGLTVTLRAHDDEAVLSARHDEARGLRVALEQEAAAAAGE